jgi:hypothetical protein
MISMPHARRVPLCIFIFRFAGARMKSAHTRWATTPDANRRANSRLAREKEAKMLLNTDYRMSIACAATSNYGVAVRRLWDIHCQPGRKIGIADGLLSVTQRAWRLGSRRTKRNAAPKSLQ